MPPGETRALWLQCVVHGRGACHRAARGLAPAAHLRCRRQDMAYRRKCLPRLNHRAWSSAPSTATTGGSSSWTGPRALSAGRLWWSRARHEGWDPGRLKRAVSREDYTDSYLRIGHGYDTRVPFWQLVYHDCAVSTWYWGDGPGCHYDAAPEVCTRKDLQALLYGGVPLLWRSDEGYGWERNRERLMQSYRRHLHFHREVALARGWTDHEFLSPRRRPAAHPARLPATRRWSTSRRRPAGIRRPTTARRVPLAPGGYLVTGPGFRPDPAVGGWCAGQDHRGRRIPGRPSAARQAGGAGRARRTVGGSPSAPAGRAGNWRWRPASTTVSGPAT